jgi:Protein of unknown function (DUF3102)
VPHEDNPTFAPSQARPLATLAREACDTIVHIHKTGGELLQLVMSLGGTLIEARDQVSPGQWGRWLSEHCEMSERLAQSYMQLARNRSLVETNPQSSAGLSIDAALRYVRKIIGTTKPITAITTPDADEPCPRCGGRMITITAEEPDAEQVNDAVDQEAAEIAAERAEHTIVNGAVDQAPDGAAAIQPDAAADDLADQIRAAVAPDLKATPMPVLLADNEKALKALADLKRAIELHVADVVADVVAAVFGVEAGGSA